MSRLIMPGSFPGYSTVAEPVDHMNILRTRKSRQKKYRGLFHEQINIVALIELLIIYFFDQSFLKLTVRGSLQLFLAHMDWQRIVEWADMEAELFYMGNRNSYLATPVPLAQSESLEESVRQRVKTNIRYYKYATLCEILILNTVAVTDHYLRRSNRMAIPRVDWAHPRDWFNAVSSHSAAIHGDTHYEHGYMFISLIGQVPAWSVWLVIALDAVFATLQFVLFRSIFVESPEECEGHTLNETDALVEEVEDGFQGSLNVMRIEMYPGVTYSSLRKSLFSWISTASGPLASPVDPAEQLVVDAEGHIHEREHRLGTRTV